MLEILLELAPYAPIVIFIAAVADIFFVTGLLFYGGTTLGAIAVLYSNGMITFTEIAIASYIGTLMGNTINFSAGHLFGKTEYVIKRLQHPRTQKVQILLQTRGLFLFILVSRFITFTRPIYALLLGSLGIKYYRFIVYESVIALFWVIIWLEVMIYGIKFIFGTN